MVKTQTGETVRGGSQHISEPTLDLDFGVESEAGIEKEQETPGKIQSTVELGIDEEDDLDLENEAPSRWAANASLRNEYLELEELANSAQATGNHAVLAEVDRKQQAIINSFYEENKGLALKVAKKYRRVQGGNEDYIQDAVEGLMVAFHRWDPSISTFATFCQSYIKGKVNRGFNSLEYADRSYGDHTAAPHVLAAKNELTESLGRRPTSSEIAEKAEVTVGVVDRVLAGRPLRLDAPIGEDGKTLGDEVAATVSDDGAGLGDEDPEVVNSLLKLLTPRGLWTIINRDGLAGAEPMTFAAIASEMSGDGRESLRRDEVKARATMREHLENSHLPLK